MRLVVVMLLVLLLQSGLVNGISVPFVDLIMAGHPRSIITGTGMMVVLDWLITKKVRFNITAIRGLLKGLYTLQCGCKECKPWSGGIVSTCPWGVAIGVVQYYVAWATTDSSHYPF